MNDVVKHKTRGGMLLPLSKDTKDKNGVAPCLYEIDEYHGSMMKRWKVSQFSKHSSKCHCLSCGPLCYDILSKEEYRKSSRRNPR